MSRFRVIEGGMERGADQGRPLVWNRQPLEHRLALVILDNPDPREPIALAYDDGRPWLIGIRCIRLPADEAPFRAWVQGARADGLEVRDERAAPTVDPFAAAEAANQRRAQQEALQRHQRAKAARRAAEPLPEGGLWDETSQRAQDLFAGPR